MKVRYNGETEKLLMQDGVPYEVTPGLEFEIERLPDSSEFEEVKAKPNKPPNTTDADPKGDVE